MTVPNGLTLARLVMTPWVVKRLHDNPRTWPTAAAFAFSDNFDGILARAGNTRPRLARLGFRTSEFGRKADPLTDKIFTAAVVSAGMHNGVIPVGLGGVDLDEERRVITNFAALPNGAGEPCRRLLQNRQTVRARTPGALGELVDVIPCLFAEQPSQPYRLVVEKMHDQS